MMEPGGSRAMVEPAESVYGGGSAAASYGRPPMMESSDACGGGGAASYGRPPSLASNSRPPLDAASLMQQASANLQTPWGSAADIPSMAPRHSRGGGSSPFAPSEGFIAGMPSGGRKDGRSVSLPCRQQANRSGDCLPGGYAPESSYGRSSGGSAGNRRYASPLSH